MRRKTPEHRAKIAASVSEARMAWCPSHLRDEHRRLVKAKRIPSAQARQIILEQARVESFRTATA